VLQVFPTSPYPAQAGHVTSTSLFPGIRRLSTIRIGLANNIAFTSVLLFQRCLYYNSPTKLSVDCSVRLTETIFKGPGIRLFAEVGDNLEGVVIAIEQGAPPRTV
jgi:hypothetical protein